MKKQFFIILFILLAIILFAIIHLKIKHNNEEIKVNQRNINAPIEILEESIISYEEALKIDKPIVLLLYVDWCSACRRYMPVFSEVAKEYKDKYSFVAANCDYPQYRNMIEEFHIMGLPNVFLIDKKIDLRYSLQLASMVDKNVMKEELDRYLKSRNIMFK